jgi:hypothetical protein
MTQLSDIATKIRSKNAGPFWLTIDSFCETDDRFVQASKVADSARVADCLGASITELKRFEIADLRVLKFSLPRPEIQGTRLDRDMHGASFANLLAQLDEQN